jgi:hypothetical protein
MSYEKTPLFITNELRACRNERILYLGLRKLCHYHPYDWKIAMDTNNTIMIRLIFSNGRFFRWDVSMYVIEKFPFECLNVMIPYISSDIFSLAFSYSPLEKLEDILLWCIQNDLYGPGWYIDSSKVTNIYYLKILTNILKDIEDDSFWTRLIHKLGINTKLIEYVITTTGKFTLHYDINYEKLHCKWHQYCSNCGEIEKERYNKRLKKKK